MAGLSGDLGVEPFQRNTRARWIRLAAVVVAAVVGVVLVAVAARHDDPGSSAPSSTVSTVAGVVADIEVVIPAGTWAERRAGTPVDVLADSVTLRVGQRLILRNEDDGAHSVGPYLVAPHDAQVLSFDHATVVAGACTLSVSGQCRIEVVASTGP